MEEIILAKYGELALKGNNRPNFENILMKTIRRRLALAGRFKVYKAQSTVYIEPLDDETDITKAVEFTSKIFGIAAINRAKITKKDIGIISEDACIRFEEDLRKAKTFKVSCKRSDKSFPFNSMEISAEVGSRILDNYPHLTVVMKNPDCEVFVEIRDYAAYIHSGKIPSAGGMPSGTSGRAISLISGGFDSPVASYLMAKRGLDIIGLHFLSPPYTSDYAFDKVVKLAGKISEYSGNVPLIAVPFTEVMVKIWKNCDESLFTVLMRRSMMRIAEEIAGMEHCKAIITGESLGQVASQTLDAIQCTDAASSLPVLRPLVGMDKVDIIALAREIGTYDISVLPYDDCCSVFVPKKPKTRPRLEEILYQEEKGDYRELEKKAVENISIQVLHYYDGEVRDES